MSNAPGCKVKKAGDPIELGDMVGNGQEPDLISGRVVAIFADGRIAYRTYRSQDEPWPTGDYRVGRLVYPHFHFADGNCSRMIWP